MSIRYNLLITFLTIFFVTNFIYALAPSIVITEIAASLSSEEEWFEIANVSQSEIDLNGWHFVEGFTASNPDGSRHELKAVKNDLILEPQEYAVIVNSEADFLAKYPDYDGTLIDSSWSSLKEDGEFIQLLNKDNQIIEAFTYQTNKEGFLTRVNPLLADYSTENWIIVNQGTPGKKNEIPNTQTTSSTDNQITPTTTQPTSPITNPITPIEIMTNFAPTAKAVSDKKFVYLGEEIIFDASNSSDQNGDSLKYIWNFGDEATAEEKIAKHKYLSIGDYEIRLKVSDSELDDEDKLYVSVLENPSPPTAQITAPVPSAGPETLKRETNQSKTSALDKKTTLQGIVLAPPGLFAKTYFYFRDQNGKSIEVYSHNGDFPSLIIGQMISVQGEITETADGKHLKITDRNVIKILAESDELPKPQEISQNEIQDIYLGELVKLTGRILKEEGKIFLVDDVGRRLKIEIYPTTVISKKELKENDIFHIIGILDKTQAGFRLLPRQPKDITATSQPNQNNQSSSSDAAENKTGEVKGERTDDNSTTAQVQNTLKKIDFKSVEDVIVLPPNKNQKQVVYKYLTSTAIALLIVLAGLWIKEWRAKKNC
jgi:hypothetical protein